MTPTPELTPPPGVTPEVWGQFAKPDGARWMISERNAVGEIIGTAYRFRDGQKGFEQGGKRGLIFICPLTHYAGSSKKDPIFVCEGASDTAALHVLGLDAVGIPMTGYCGEMLAELLAGRHVVVVRDADETGKNGADKIVSQLLLNCHSVRVIDPPVDAKDAREAVLNGATAQDFLELANLADSIQVPLLGSGLPGMDFRLVKLGELSPSRETDWLLPGVIALGGITLLTGLWKSGKSTLLAHLLRDLYRGTGLVDTALDRPTIIVSEEPMEIWSGRRDELGLDSYRIHFLQRPSLARCSPEEWSKLVATLVRGSRDLDAALIVIDTLPGIWPVADENNASEVLETLMQLRDIAQAGAALLLFHHPRKSESHGFTSARGSGALSGFPDILTEFARIGGDPKSKQRTLSAIGRYGGGPTEILLELTEDGYTVVGTSSHAQQVNELDLIAEILRNERETVTAEHIRDQWPLNPRIGLKRLRGLLQKGTTAGLWTQEGKGTRGDPIRFGSLVDPFDSIPFSLHPENELGIGSNEPSSHKNQRANREQKEQEI